jgi:transposase InsO family protein
VISTVLVTRDISGGRRIVGWSMRSEPESKLVVDALEMAIAAFGLLV